MRFKLFFVLLMTAGLLGTSCSNSKKNEEPIEQAGVEQDQVLEDADFIVDADDTDLLLEEETDAEFLDDEFNEVQSDDQGALLATEEMDKASEGMVESQSSPVIANEEVKEYTVQKGDTLLWIAFKLYGDYARWTEISNMNNGVRMIKEGQVLSYVAPEVEFEWNPEGLPHLVKKGETLGIISNEHYGTESRWRDIYENNQPMIKDPDLIFAGFTLYYVPDEERGVASDEGMTN